MGARRSGLLSAPRQSIAAVLGECLKCAPTLSTAKGPLGPRALSQQSGKSGLAKAAFRPPERRPKCAPVSLEDTWALERPKWLGERKAKWVGLWGAFGEPEECAN